MKKYKPLIDDWEAFQRQSGEHPLQGVRRNPLKAQNDFEDRLSESFDFEESSWNGDVYRVSSEKPGKSLLHWRGEYYVQEESAALPVKILDPQPGEMVLDMCAAPGGKATQMAALMDNEGLVVANDESSQRMKSLHANVYRTGSSIVSASNYDGRNIPESESFDRVLVDAPCSGEGDRYYRNFESADNGESVGLSRLQQDLVKKAGKLLKDNGVIIYSTCTITPIENEKVVSEILENTDLELERIETDAEHVRGVSEFQGEEFGEEMSKTVRVYPHHLDSGVIYVAKFVKPDDSDNNVESSIHLSPENEAESYLQDRFGVDTSGLTLRQVNGDYWLTSPKQSTLEFKTEGVRAIRVMDIGLKPTTYLLQLIENRIEKNVTEVSYEELEILAKEEGLIQKDMNDKGYIALKFDGRVIGCGFYMDGLISSRIPEGRMKELLECI